MERKASKAISSDFAVFSKLLSTTPPPATKAKSGKTPQK